MIAYIRIYQNKHVDIDLVRKGGAYFKLLFAHWEAGRCVFPEVVEELQL